MSTEIDHDAVMRALQEMEDAPPFHIAIDPLMLFFVVGQCQLALRHPENTGPSAAAAREFINQVRDTLFTDPVLLEILRQGDDPEYDVTTDESASPMMPERRCRVCGCTDEAGCRPACYWVAPDLCSACLPAAQRVTRL
ncbi:MAG: hypothetical protein A2W00_04595 [Candidatus Eisenbacteria bacterium RBG_16_71_46]|nr:MAG: hypothetical protein A2W00_04595 [Candidatus Eisenbacteria bacterium RBG_16_71_46]